MLSDKLAVVKKPKFLLGLLCIITLLGLAFTVSTMSRVIRERNAEIERLNSEIEELKEAPALVVNTTDTISLEYVRGEMRGIGELATMEYFYTDAGKYEKPLKMWDKGVPFTKKSFVAKWDGVIKAGIDVTKVTTEIDEDAKIILIGLPEVETLSHEIDENSVETLDEKDGLFNPVKVDDVREFDADSKADMEQRAKDLGLYEKAEANAKTIIQQLLNANSIIAEHYKIKFVAAK